MPIPYQFNISIVLVITYINYVFSDLHAITLAIHGLTESEWQTLTSIRKELIEAISRQQDRRLSVAPDMISAAIPAIDT